MVICPSCNGAKEGPAFVDGTRDGRRFGEFRMMKCHTCKGTGEVSEEFAIRQARGRQERDARLARNQTQRERADELGMDVAQYSRCEHGIPDCEGDWGKFLGIVEMDGQDTQARS